MNCLVVLVDFVWLGNTQTPPQSSCGISEVSLKLPFFETHIMTGTLCVVSCVHQGKLSIPAPQQIVSSIP